MNLKKNIFLILLTTNTYVNAQDVKNWQIGLNLNPFLFSKLGNENVLSKDNQKYPNGVGFGLTIEKNWNDNWGIKSGFDYTTQKINYKISDSSENEPRVTTEYEYFKAPLSIQYYHLLNEKFYLIFSQGFQISFLNYFRTVYEDKLQRIVYSSNFGETIVFNNPENSSQSNGDCNAIFHNPQLFGILGSIGVKKYINERFSYTMLVKYEYDFTSPDKTQYYLNSKKSHNFRIGFEFGLQFSLKSPNDRFNKTPQNN
jgi:hypothetical protein